jgi:hypothetical protein
MNFNDLSIFDIIAQSAESRLFNVQWNRSGFNLICSLPDLNDYCNLENNQFVMLEIKTNIVSYNFPENMHNIHSCYFRLIELEKNINVNAWGYYSPSEEKKEFMRQLRNRCFMAFGTHSKKYKWLFQILGDKNYLDAMVQNIDDIKVYLFHKRRI